MQVFHEHLESVLGCPIALPDIPVIAVQSQVIAEEFGLPPVIPSHAPPAVHANPVEESPSLHGPSHPPDSVVSAGHGSVGEEVDPIETATVARLIEQDLAVTLPSLLDRQTSEVPLVQPLPSIDETGGLRAFASSPASIGRSKRSIPVDNIPREEGLHTIVPAKLPELSSDDIAVPQDVVEVCHQVEVAQAHQRAVACRAYQQDVVRQAIISGHLMLYCADTQTYVSCKYAEGDTVSALMAAEHAMNPHITFTVCDLLGMSLPWDSPLDKHKLLILRTSQLCVPDDLHSHACAISQLPRDEALFNQGGAVAVDEMTY